MMVSDGLVLVVVVVAVGWVLRKKREDKIPRKMVRKAAATRSGLYKLGC